VLKRGSSLYDDQAVGSRPIRGDFNCFLVQADKVKHYPPSQDYAQLKADLDILFT
jgi:hypothetical protein